MLRTLTLSKNCYCGYKEPWWSTVLETAGVEFHYCIPEKNGLCWNNADGKFSLRKHLNMHEHFYGNLSKEINMYICIYTSWNLSIQDLSATYIACTKLCTWVIYIYIYAFISRVENTNTCYTVQTSIHAITWRQNHHDCVLKEDGLRGHDLCKS